MRWGVMMAAVPLAMLVAGTTAGCKDPRDAEGQCLLGGETTSHDKVVSCSKPHDGKIVASVSRASDCPAGTDWSYTARDQKVQCVHNEKNH
ncbi:hypothetical protein D7D52_18535 [Nocardia yunnanensis]|uniref:DUF3761 domain-containing protein n=1 Tax=Nocardia yunnanensis TaxID=2382165 RepID=A0A386ZDF5_9NOCA|nr:hypothetical protein [Nocardia yunnanensis]AYF75518.1 hypothetical protein D7D52_18535 [Nocardia yunnanensis]